MSAEEEVNMKDEDLLEEKHKQRAAQRKNRSDASQVWEWLGHLKGTRERWARVFTRESTTRGTIKTNAADALHSAIKHNSRMARRLLEMIIHIERRKDKLVRRKAVRTAKMEAVHTAQAEK